MERDLQGRYLTLSKLAENAQAFAPAPAGVERVGMRGDTRPEN